MKHSTFAFDPTCEELRPLREYAQRLPSSRAGKRVHPATLYRWALKGLSGGTPLRTVRMGGGRFTCDAWVAEFMEPGPTASSGPVAQSELSQADRERIQQRFRSAKVGRRSR